MSLSVLTQTYATRHHAAAQQAQVEVVALSSAK